MAALLRSFSPRTFPGRWVPPLKRLRANAPFLALVFWTGTGAVFVYALLG